MIPRLESLCHLIMTAVPRHEQIIDLLTDDTLKSAPPLTTTILKASERLPIM